MTAPLNQPPPPPPSPPNAVTLLSLLTNTIWRVIMCAPRLRRQQAAVRRRQVLPFAPVAVTSQKTRGKHPSLLTSSVCLAARLIAGVCPATGGAGAHAAKRNPAPASHKQTGIYGFASFKGEVK